MAVKLYPGLRKLNSLIWRKDRLLGRAAEALYSDMVGREKGEFNDKYAILGERINNLSKMIEKEGIKVASYYSRNMWHETLQDLFP